MCILHAPRPNNVSYVDGAVSEVEKQGGVGHVIDTAGYPRVASSQGVIPVAVQQAGHDVVRGLRECAEWQREAAWQWLVMIEDDMVPCEGALEKVTEALELYKDAACIFFSKFSRAFAMSRQYLAGYVSSVLARIDSQPYDIVLRTGVWTDGRLVTYPVNLFHHVGQVSTVQERNEPEFRRRYEALRSDTCGENMTG